MHTSTGSLHQRDKQVTVMSTSNQVNQISSAVSKKANTQKRNNDRKRFGGCCRCGFRLPKRSELSPLNFLKPLGSSKVAKALCLWRIPSPARVSSSSRKSRPFIASNNNTDSHRTEAIEDCVEFINSSSSTTTTSSSSFPRSNSVAANHS